MKRATSKPILIAEFILLIVVLPILLTVALNIKYLLPIIWAVALYCYVMERAFIGQGLRAVWRPQAVTRAALKPIFIRFLISAAAMTAFTLALSPELLFSFVREKPAFWLLVMVLYPILSVIPQEIIFRSFFFARYQHLFTKPAVIIAASAIAFGFAHILFHNWVAPFLCLIGGVFFAKTYQIHRSLSLVAIEHALYGNFLFTIGLGRYFYHGTVAAAL